MPKLRTTPFVDLPAQVSSQLSALMQREAGDVEMLKAFDFKESVVCVACGGTGRASNGGFCLPCVVNGRVEACIM